MKEQALRTFQIVHRDRVISPILTTIREYGEWFENTFDTYTVNQELYMKSIKKDGERVLESHPGTNLGRFFDKNKMFNPTLLSWYILKDSTMMEKLKKMGIVEYRDAVPIAVNDDEHRQMVRIYTIDQLELYIRSNIDKGFRIAPFVSQPKQIKIRDSDLDKIIMPKEKAKRTKSLF